MRVGNAPTSKLDSIIQMNLRSYTIYRKSASATNQYGSGPDTDQYTESHTEQLYCYFPDDRTVTVEQGEVTRGSLDGYARPSADIEPDDRLDHGGARYEVDVINEIPDAADPVTLELRLSRVTE